jgi:hypothetical protein
MAQPSATFTDELAWVVELLDAAEGSLRRLHHLAGYEQLPVDVGRRLKLKANGVEVQRTSLEEIVDGTLG